MPSIPPPATDTDAQTPSASAAAAYQRRDAAWRRVLRLRLMLILGLFISLGVFVVGVVLALTPSSKFSTLSAVVGTVGFMCLLAICAAGGYVDHWVWTGVGPASYRKTENVDYQPGKTLWDALQLLIIPLALAVLGLWFTTQQNTADEKRNDLQHKTDNTIAAAQRTTDLHIADARQKDGILDAYLDHMSDLVLMHHLGSRPPSRRGDPVAAIANARTLAALRRLDNVRNAFLTSFLVNSKLLTYVNLSHNDLTRARLARTRFKYVQFVQTTLTNADFYKAHLENTRFNDANLKGADFNGAYLTGADFSGTDTNLEGASFKNATLENALLNDADLTGANLSEATLLGAHLSTSKSVLGTQLNQAILFKTNLDGARLKGVDLTGANLTKATLHGTNLSGANLSHAILDGADLTGAIGAKAVTSWSGASWKHTVCPDGTSSATNHTNPSSCRGHGFS